MAIDLISQKNRIHDSIIHFSLNLLHDGRLILFNYILPNAACKTDNNYKDKIAEQVDFHIWIDGSMEVLPSNGCGCIKFELFYDEDIPLDWKDKLEVWEAFGDRHVLRPAGFQARAR